MGRGRRFLFLQGPHGPFFSALARQLRHAGAEVFRVGVNGGDRALWRGRGYIPFKGSLDDWPRVFGRICREKGITDLVLYGGSRPLHRIAVGEARAMGLRLHILEEGYLRPYWATYEREGTNADSPVRDVPTADMAAALAAQPVHLDPAPDRWGDMAAHMLWGAVYHAALLFGRRAYPDFRPHRAPDVPGELKLYLRRLSTQPARGLLRRIATWRVRYGGFPFHLVLLQLAHDANFRDHGPFRSQAAFLEEVFRAFAAGAPGHHHLVLKAHPLEDGREPLRPLIRRLTKAHGLEGRVHYLSGGKLAWLLTAAKSAVTVNSTSGEQALWHGIPLKAFGRAVYRRRGFTSEQPLADFFANPTAPDHDDYFTYRAFLLATSQIPGGFYALKSRRTLLRKLPDLMLAERDRYSLLLDPLTATDRQHLRIVS